jgi:thymidylate kinase
MKIIAISGLDGSGKSTQIKMLKSHLEREGSKVFYFHAIEFGLANRIVEFRNKYCLICKLIGKCKVKNNQFKSVTRASGFQIWLRKIFLQIDIWRFEKLRNKLRNSNYNYILSDRYFYDSLVNIEYLKNICHREQISHLTASTQRGELARQEAISNEIAASPLAPHNDKIVKPDIAIYLKTDPEIIMSRRRTPDQGLEYLKTKKELYDNNASVFDMKIIDGNRDKEEIFEEIKTLFL